MSSGEGNTAAQRRRLEDLMRLPENRECCDCSAKHPRWGSTNLGVFFCLRCAGLHRALGTHLSKVKSTTMDTWEESMIRQGECIGNARGRLLYEHAMPPRLKPSPSTNNATVELFIREKYERKVYYHPQYTELLRTFLENGPATATQQQQQQQPGNQEDQRAAQGNGRLATGSSGAAKTGEWSDFVDSAVPMLWDSASVSVATANQTSAPPPRNSGLSVDELFGHSAGQQQQQQQQQYAGRQQTAWGSSAPVQNYYYSQPYQQHLHSQTQQFSQQQQNHQQQYQQQQQQQQQQHQHNMSSNGANGDAKSEIMSLFGNPTSAQSHATHLYSAWQPKSSSGH